MSQSVVEAEIQFLKKATVSRLVLANSNQHKEYLTIFIFVCILLWIGYPPEGYKETILRSTFLFRQRIEIAANFCIKWLNMELWISIWIKKYVANKYVAVIFILWILNKIAFVVVAARLHYEVSARLNTFYTSDPPTDNKSEKTLSFLRKSQSPFHNKLTNGSQ